MVDSVHKFLFRVFEHEIAKGDSFSYRSRSHIHLFLRRVVFIKCKVMLDGGPSLQKQAIRNLAMLLLVLLINFCRRMYKLCLSVSFTASSI